MSHVTLQRYIGLQGNKRNKYKTFSEVLQIDLDCVLHLILSQHAAFKQTKL